MYGSVRLDAFTPGRLADPVVLSLIPKVELVVDKEFDDLFPTRRGARVTIDDDLTATRPTRKGDPDDPLSDADLRAKYDELVGPALGPGRAATLAADLWDLPSVGDVRNLLPR